MTFGIGFRRIEFLLRSPELLIGGLEGRLLPGESFLIELDFEWRRFALGRAVQKVSPAERRLRNYL